MVLLFCLIFLTALTLLGLSASADAILQSKLAANLQESERAKQSALSALSWAEQWLLSQTPPAPEKCFHPCDGLYIHSPGEIPPHPEYENLSWWLAHGYEAGLDPISGDRITTVANNGTDPAIWVIEALHELPPEQNGTTDLQAWYRILARGNGRTKNVVSVIESTIVRSWSSTEDEETPGAQAPANCPGSEPTAKCGRLTWRELR